MNHFAAFAGLAGACALSVEGEIGFIGPDGRFAGDPDLNRQLLDHSTRYLAAYVAAPDPAMHRLGIIYHAATPRSWGRETVLLEEQIVRRLYPVGGAGIKDLTEFQRRSRETSVYRAIELLLEYKSDAAPTMPVYCPVVLDRGMTLAHCGAGFAGTSPPPDAQAPVVELINLLSTVPPGRRDAAPFPALRTRIFMGVVRKSARRGLGLTLADAIDTAPDTAAVRGKLYADADPRAERAVTLEAAGVSVADSAGTRFLRRIEGALQRRPGPVDVATLKLFERFRAFDHGRLMRLAAHSMVYCVPAGTRLLERGTSDSWNLYLLEGRVELVAADGMAKFLDGGAANARQPVSSLKPRMYTVSAVTPVCFLWIDDAEISGSSSN